MDSRLRNTRFFWQKGSEDVNSNDANGLEKEHRERSDGAQVSDLVVLDVAKRMGLSAGSRVHAYARELVPHECGPDRTFTK
jgi:hypothetical protein